MNSEDGLSFEGELPLSFKKIAEYPKTGQLSFINDSNESFIKTSMLLDEPFVDFDEHDEIKIELRKQDHKINLILDMLSELLREKKEIPDVTPLNLSSSSLTVQKAAVGQVLDLNFGQKFEILLYILPSTPRPLSLFAEVAACDDTNAAYFRFKGLSQGVRESLEKIIFRHHRRAVALAHENS